MSLRVEEVMPALPVTDLERARSFYVDVVGLEELERTDREVVLAAGPSSRLLLNLRDEPPRARNTAASFTVADLRPAMAVLRRRGVEFHDYDLPGIRTVDGVWEEDGCLTAWCDDTEGNILCFCSDQRASARNPSLTA